MSRNYGPPMAYPGILYDLIGFQQTVRKLNLLQKTYQAKIIFPHDLSTIFLPRACTLFLPMIFTSRS